MDMIRKITRLFNQNKNEQSLYTGANKLSLDDIYELTSSYTETLTAMHDSDSYPGFKYPEKLLSYSKVEIKKALMLRALASDDPKEVELCGDVYYQLAYFVSDEDVTIAKRYHEAQKGMTQNPKSHAHFLRCKEAYSQYSSIDERMCNYIFALIDEWNEFLRTTRL